MIARIFQPSGPISRSLTLLALGGVFVGNPIRADGAELDKQIQGILAAQAKAWNAGDIEAFMQYYWKSPQLTFSSGGKVTRGWETTRDNYVRRYPTPEAMGTVHFDQLEITALGESACLVLGRWRLERESEPVGGSFTLVFRRFDDQWRIVHDHTSRAEP